MNSMKIAVLGLGYVGLVTALCFASKHGFEVVGVDVDELKVSKLRKCEAPVYEPGLGDLLEESLSKNFRPTTDFAETRGSKVVFITVGTPPRGDGSPNLAYVEEAARYLGAALKETTEKAVVAVKSTVPPGTARNIVGPAVGSSLGKPLGAGFGLASNPEFLAEGSAVEDMLHPDRVVVGVYDSYSRRVMRALYEELYGKELGGAPYLETSLENAELVKYANNAFLSLKVSFINELSRICESTLNTDVDVVAKGIGFDKRIGQYFLRAGPGWGGSCFGKDVSALIRHSERVGAGELKVLRANLASNEAQKVHVVELLEKELGGLGHKKVAVLGLAFKAETDDARDSQAATVIAELLKRGATVRAYDPMATRNFVNIYGLNADYCESAEACVEGCDATLVLTDWEEFRRLKPAFFEDKMQGGVLLDARRIYRGEAWAAGSKLRYVALGVNPQLGFMEDSSESKE
jgi:UDPglucose 6-dehydrogenase